MARFDVRLLGAFRVECGGVVLDAGPRRVRELLACLLLEQRAPVSRALLAYRLWPDSTEGRARSNLRQALHQLRARLPDVAGLLLFDGSDLRWRERAPIDLDVERFEQHLAGAAAAREAGTRELEQGALQAAIALYEGDLLPEVYAAWVEPYRARLRDAYAGALERLLAALSARDDVRPALDVAQRLQRHDPLAEGPYQALIELYERCGDRAKALHVYHSCEAVLRRELGVEPTGQTRALYERVVGARSPPTNDVGGSAASDDPVAPLALIGRHDELSSVLDAWRQGVGRTAQLVLVTGDAGIGTTRLVEECARRLRAAQAAVALARCYAEEGELSYAPIAALLRSVALRTALVGLGPVWRREVGRLLPDLVPESASAAPSGLRRARLFEAVARAFAAVPNLVAILDDLHWSDPDTLALLHYLLRYEAGARLLLLATARSDELAAGGRLGAWLSAVREEGRVHELPLAPLTSAESAALAQNVAGRSLEADMLQGLYRESEGNPLFLVELLGAAASVPLAAAAAEHTGLPPRLRDVIHARLERLSPVAADVAASAAVIGRSFDLGLLLAVCDGGDDVGVRGIDELWRRRVVRELGAGQYDFTHDKLREVCYAELSEAWRRHLHVRVAEALATRHGQDAGGDAALIAHHFDRGGRPVDAIEAYRAAAAASRRRYAEVEARAHYRRAAELLEGLAPGSVTPGWRASIGADLLEGSGELAARAGEHVTACELFTKALAARPVSDGVGRARLWRRLGDAWVVRHRHDEAQAAYDAAEQLLAPAEGDVDASRERIELGLALADLRYWQGRWDEMERELVALRQVAVEHAWDHQRARLSSRLSMRHFLRERRRVSDECLGLAAEAYEAALRSSDADVITQLGFGLGFMHLWRDELDAAERLLWAAQRDAERVGDAVLRARALTYLGVTARLNGDGQRVRRLASEVLRSARSLALPEYVGVAFGQRAWLAWRSGDDAGCGRAARAALEAWSSGPVFPLQWIARLPLLAAALRQGRLDEARDQGLVMLEAPQQRLPDAVDAALIELHGRSACDAAPLGLRASLEVVVAAALASARL